MIVLGVDTATPACSVAVGNETGVLFEELTTVAETHSRHLLRLVRQVCASAGIDIEAVDGYAVTGGPGSFTGLRIGISTVKGLCYALHKPLVAVSTLEVLACQACRGPGMDGSETILALIDARRGEVYAGWYSRDADGRLKASGTEQAAPMEEVIRRSASMRPLRVVGDGALRYRREVACAFGTEAICPDVSAHVPRASTLVQLAMPRFPEGKTVDAASFAPEYIRKPDIRLPTG
ncbi:MAG: tRNA (adenosine(37)-N6)-threonylcarbamoyltransferase complex dimerization subunit type 1 TsaB [Thermodesulfobacteriota bacterium]